VDIKVRMLKRSDAAEMVSGLNNCLPYDRVTVETFQSTIFEDPNYEPAGNLAATFSGEIIGFVAAVAREGIAGHDGAGKTHEKDFGYIKALFSFKEYPAAKRELLEKALVFLKSKGKQIARVGEYTGRYFTPGVDARYKEELRFYISNGFEQVDVEEDVSLDLENLQPTEYQRRAQAKIRNMGIAIRRYEPELLDRMRQFVKKINYPQWFPKGWEFSFNRKSHTLVALLGASIVGWAEFYRSNETWFFGPIAVLDEFRQKGVGTCLLLESVYQMKDFGALNVTAGWANVPFYQKNGWRTSRQYIVLQKNLSEQLLH
jgi:GNAT superfamily N-acetyltransferase